LKNKELRSTTFCRSRAIAGGLGDEFANKFAATRGGGDDDQSQNLPADPRGPLGLDYRQIGLEHFLIGAYPHVARKAQSHRCAHGRIMTATTSYQAGQVNNDYLAAVRRSRCSYRFLLASFGGGIKFAPSGR